MRVPLVLGTAGLVAGAWACCAVSTLQSLVTFGGQANIVIWDPATKTEHFVRNAEFFTEAKDLGFIAPSPTEPELAEASKEAFDTLARLEPPRAMKDAGKSDRPTEAATGGPVSVIRVQDVAGYRATVLRATDAAALAAWMKENGYRTTPAIERWTEFYIAKDWYLTAFKVQAKAGEAATGVVRMTFKTEKPFNPYYVPSDNIDERAPSSLMLFFVAPGRYSGLVGGTTKWAGSRRWEAELTSNASNELARHLKLDPAAIPANCTVANYMDGSFPNSAGDDVYFSFVEDVDWETPLQKAMKVAAVMVLVGVGIILILRYRGSRPVRKV